MKKVDNDYVSSQTVLTRLTVPVRTRHRHPLHKTSYAILVMYSSWKHNLVLRAPPLITFPSDSQRLYGSRWVQSIFEIYKPEKSPHTGGSRIVYTRRQNSTLVVIDRPFDFVFGYSLYKLERF